MSYCTAAHWKMIEAVHLDLAWNTEGVVDEVKINAAIGQASAIADSWLAGRYRVPVTEPDRVKLIEAQIVPMVTYVLARGGGANSEDITKRYNSAIDWFKQVGRGLIKLPDSQNTTGPTSADDFGNVRFSARPRRF